MAAPTKTQLIGGNFQDSEGNLLANGYLRFYLNQDETVTGVAEVCSGIYVTILLNSSGSVITSPAQYIWGNDDMTPTNSYYRVEGYTASGQLAWGPNNQQVASGSSFDVGTWVPNQVISWNPPLQPLVLQVNGTDNVDQQLLNLSASTNMTITDQGNGSVTFAAAGGGSFTSAGIGAFYGNGITTLFGQNVVAGKIGAVANAVYVYGFILETTWTLRSASYLSENSASNAYFGFGIYSLAGNALLTTSFLSTGTTSNNVVTNTFSGVTFSPGTYYWAQSVDNSALVAPGFELQYSGQSPEDLFPLINANSQNYAMIAANVMGTNTGVMPATLGALTALSSSAQGQIGIATVKFTP
jgi:hypothetical protein